MNINLFKEQNQHSAWTHKKLQLGNSDFQEQMKRTMSALNSLQHWLAEAYNETWSSAASDGWAECVMTNWHNETFCLATVLEWRSKGVWDDDCNWFPFRWVVYKMHPWWRLFYVLSEDKVPGKSSVKTWKRRKHTAAAHLVLLRLDCAFWASQTWKWVTQNQHKGTGLHKGIFITCS